MAVPGQPRGVGDVEDQGVVLRTALGLENMPYRFRVEAVGPQAVDRFRGDAQQAAVPEDGGGGRDVMPGEKPCFHVAISAPLS